MKKEIEQKFDVRANWQDDLVRAMRQYGETWNDVVADTFTDKQNEDELKSCGYYGATAFTVWSKNRVYFPAKYDGREWVASVSRNPDGRATLHVGGG